MKRQIHILSMLLFTWVLLPVSGPAQVAEAPVLEPADTTDAGTSPEKASGSTSGEVEISEDNYRRFMELKDVRRERNFITDTVFQPKGNLQKIDELPEDSQKHLRNQLREVILQGEQWKPGDELVDHPYASSEAALTNQPLQKLEAEAWSELVGEYHQREAEIYANSARSKAAMASAPKLGGGAGGEDGSDSGNGGHANTGIQAGQQSNNGRGSATRDSYSSNSGNDPNANSTVGVAQNALEFLTKNGHPSDQQQTTQAVSGELVLPAGTLAIKDLVNARGVSVMLGTDKRPDDVVDEQDDSDG